MDVWSSFPEKVSELAKLESSEAGVSESIASRRWMGYRQGSGEPGEAPTSRKSLSALGPFV